MENIFKWDLNFNLEEKDYFYNNIRNIFSSNYIDKIGDSIFDEVYVNGENSSEQYFYLNGKKLNYSIYPLILENLNGEKEHVFSIIYLYNDELYFEDLNKYNSSMTYKIILELIFFIIFGSGLLI